MILKVKNNLDESAQYTYLTSKETSGIGSVSVQNNTGFINQWAIQLGKTGEEKTEIVIGTASGNTEITCEALLFDHPTDTPVYYVKWDKLILLRSTSGTSGTATAFATTDITPDAPYTLYDDTTGVSTYAYKSKFYNSVTDTTSSLSGWLTSSGYTYYSLGAMTSRVKGKLFSDQHVTDDDIADYLNEYYELLTNTAIDVNRDYALGTTQVTFAANVALGTITDTDFKQIRRIWMTDGAGTYPANKMETIDPRPNQSFSKTDPYFYIRDENVVERFPSADAGTADILYYKYNTVLSSPTDELPQYMQGYTRGFIDYAVSESLEKEGQSGKKRWERAMLTHESFKKELVPRNKTGVGYIDVVESVGEDTSEFWNRV